MKELFLLKNAVDQFPPHNLFPAVFSEILGIFSVCLFCFFFWLRKIPLEVHWTQCLWWTMVNGPSLSKSFFYLNIRIFCDEILPWLPLFQAHTKKIRRVSGTELYYKEAYFGVRCEWSLMQCLHYKFYHVALCCIILPVFVL